MLVLTVAREILLDLVPVTSLTSPTLFFTLFRHTGLHSAFNVPSTLPPRGLCTCCSLWLKGRFPASLQIWLFLDSGLSSRIAASGRPSLTTESRLRCLVPEVSAALTSRCTRTYRSHMWGTFMVNGSSASLEIRLFNQQTLL